MHSPSFSPSVNKLVDDIEDWWRNADRRMQMFLKAGSKKHFEGRPSTCDSCTAPGCCYQQVYVRLAETFPIARRLQLEGQDTPELRNFLRGIGDDMEASTRAGWLSRQTPCVFLGEDDRCTVHEQRPAHCRTYWVYSPQENCQPPTGQKVRLVDPAPVIDPWLRIANDIHRSLGLKETAKRILLGALPRVLLIFLEAMDSDDFRKHVRNQVWPTDTTLDQSWIDGNNPIGKRLAQLRRSKPAPAS